MEHYLVESSHTSETFLVKWSTYINPQEGTVEWDQFLVFRIDEEGNAVYTEDFGGVCIFLSKAESFCLPAACLHDQRPNCIYHLSKNSFGIRCMDDNEKETTGDLNFPGPFWFPPKLDSKANVVNILVLTFRRSYV
ncbi:BnaC08g46190D [Brassica napus]|uniref:BnaC08g46190D protein n=3 Tax=Brassica TaxID=3705 RepID=A0A078JXB3_BRANA|nr:BnaC08g46190D [Brassica napus]VDD53885.1 unnamed protein product [Brassica oleracea]